MIIELKTKQDYDCNKFFNNNVNYPLYSQDIEVRGR